MVVNENGIEFGHEVEGQHVDEDDGGGQSRRE